MLFENPDDCVGRSSGKSRVSSSFQKEFPCAYLSDSFMKELSFRTGTRGTPS
jgi:hypothetical protein